MHVYTDIQKSESLAYEHVRLTAGLNLHMKYCM